MRVVNNEVMTIVSKHQDLQNGVKVVVFSTGEILMQLLSDEDLSVDENNGTVLCDTIVYNKTNIQFMGLCV